jgi:hypothetical protein
MTDDLPHMKRVVEQYIFDKKGIWITIIFDDLMRMHLHFKMLAAAYDIAFAYNNKSKT